MGNSLIVQPDPTNYGWSKDDDGISVQCFSDGHRDFLPGSLSNESAVHAKRVCTSLCVCVDCSNETTDEIEDGNHIDSDDELQDYNYVIVLLNTT